MVSKANLLLLLDYLLVDLLLLALVAAWMWWRRGDGRRRLFAGPGSHRAAVRTAVLCAVGSFGWLLAGLAWQGVLNERPRVTSDAMEYDSIACELLQGNGYAIDLTDATLRATYPDATSILDREHGSSIGAHGTAAYRPPVWPTILAGTYQLFGRVFWPARVFNVCCLAVTCGLIAYQVCRFGGVWAAVASASVFTLVDWRVRSSAHELLTESLSIVLIAVVATCLLAMTERRSVGLVCGAGVSLGMAILTRTQFVLWLPILAAVVWWVGRTAGGLTLAALETTAARRTLSPLGAACGFAAIALLTASPWFVRNCIVLGRCMPLGTQGSMQRAAGWGDEAWRSYGAWTNLSFAGRYEGIVEPGLTGIRRELAIGDASTRLAKEWVAAHPVKAVVLMGFKIAREVFPRRPGQLLVGLLATYGFFALRRTPQFWIMGGMLLACLLSVAATWSVGGRFLAQALFPLHCFCGVGLCQLLSGREKASIAETMRAGATAGRRAA